ncbi:hypothetical protein V5P93_003552 [Actinokineospora auranticolor]|uniref:Tetratricopeptide repeat protein n=1 Tax=Actinokineospora auranticolor TaxID=155976 RepID=A0A2S6GPN1_9PSEU|nr:hypothetical protein [Actinokineospora auranticolor]PPK67215.1 hypothetical protein CLV40_108213 [Actinokineospora auranticolor]
MIQPTPPRWAADTEITVIPENPEDIAAAHAIRAAFLTSTGQFAEAAAAAETALEAAYATAPELAASVHLVLAEIAGTTGDPAGSAAHLDLARDLAAATGDRESEITALLSQARLAYLAADNDLAEARYEEAERLLLVTGDTRGLSVSLHGRAAVAISRGRPHDALEALDRVLAALGADAGPVDLVATYQVQGGAWAALGVFDRADERYAAATEVATRAGLWHVALGVAWWRADGLVRWASTVEGARRRELCLRALDLALPAALAAEAARGRFPHGPLRERWVALASEPATRAAFTALRGLGDVVLVAAYIDHLAATVSLEPAHADLPRDELLTLPVPETTTAFTLPPRVRIDPATPSPLDAWIDEAERRYGFPVRSTAVVASW